MSPEQPTDLHPGMQMRIPYSAPLRDQRWRMVLRGMQVQLTPEDGDTQTALEYLRCIGCFPSADELGVISVPVTEIRKVLDLPERVVIIPNGDLITLLGLLRSSPTHASNVLVSADSHQVLNLNWFSAGLDHNEPIGVGAVPALLSAGVPLVADEETWEIIHRASPLPSARASARVNLDGFIEISTPVPQHLEALAIPGLFRLDDSRFGVPLLHASTLRSIPGLIWDGRPPSYDPPPRRSPHLPITLNEHSREHVRSLTDRMSVARSQAVLWPPGSGRRVFSLAAMEQLGAFPLYVLTLPSNMWLWHRHMELFGRSYTLSPLTGSSAPDVRLLPYTELATTRRLDHPAGMILDCLDVALAEGLCRSDDMARFDGSVDAYRIAPVNSLPKEPQKLMELLSCLRPVEFPRLLPAAYRYPSPVEQRLWEHAEVYVHTSSDAPDVSMFRQSRVLRVEPPIWWGEEIARLPSIERGASLNRRERLEELLRLQSAGSESQVGPKVAHAISLASAATTEGRATAILTSVSNTADLLRGLLPPSDLLRIMHVTLDAGDIEEVRVTASSAEVVVVVDLPPCFAALDDILVPASDSQGPSVIYMLHMNGGMDDRLAVIASIRATTARFAGNKPYTTREIDYLLGDIHLEEVLA